MIGLDQAQRNYDRQEPTEAEVSAEQEAEHARWFARLRKQPPVFQNDALWDAITAKRLAQQNNEATKDHNDLYNDAALSARDARYVI